MSRLEMEESKAILQKAGQGLMAGIPGLARHAASAGRLARILCMVGPVSEIAQVIARSQLGDGGWYDIEDTIWCVTALSKCVEFRDAALCGFAWINSVRYLTGGWGQSPRDYPRIPVTGLVCGLIPKLADDAALDWIGHEWEQDMSFPEKLSYKGAFFLLATGSNKRLASGLSLVPRTIEYLRLEQNPDGGFGPWKGHPIGSDPWSTGICLVGLTSWPELIERDTIARAAEWLCDTQLESGLWRYHPIDEGSCYAYWGLREAVRYLERTS